MAYGLYDTIGALNALKTKLQAVQWNGAAAFVTVAMFDMSNLVVALQELLAIGDRVCLIVHDQERFENERRGRSLHTKQVRDIALLIADRNITNRQKALFGDADIPLPGALALKDAILNGVVGLLQPGMFIQPMHGEQIVLEKKVRDELQGRVAFTLGIQLVGGNIITDLGQQPIP
jgi:ribosomal protein S13